MFTTAQEIAKTIDHAILTATVMPEEVESTCEMARSWGIAAIFVKPCDLSQAVELLAGSSVLPGTVVGFPHGDFTTASKVFQAEEALSVGAEEIDMVCNVGWVLSGKWDQVGQDIQEVCAAVHAFGKCLKVILEACYLNEAQKIQLCEICADVGVDFVKTSTGFGSAGAQIADVVLFRDHLPPSVEIKASAGIRNLDTLIAFLDAGASRIGTSATDSILKEAQQKLAV